MRSFFWQVSRRQVDRDSFWGKRKAKRRNGSTNALTAFGYSLIRKAHNGEAHHPWGDLALDFDAAGFQAKIGDCGNYRHHILSPMM
jgi:hypothetical protein